MPLKAAVLPLLDAASPVVETVGAANTVLLRDGRRVGENTDVPGMVGRAAPTRGVSTVDRRGRARRRAPRPRSAVAALAAVTRSVPAYVRDPARRAGLEPAAAGAGVHPRGRAVGRAARRRWTRRWWSRRPPPAAPTRWSPAVPPRSRRALRGALRPVADPARGRLGGARRPGRRRPGPAGPPGRAAGVADDRRRGRRAELARVLRAAGERALRAEAPAAPPGPPSGSPPSSGRRSSIGQPRRWV